MTPLLIDCMVVVEHLEETTANFGTLDVGEVGVFLGGPLVVEVSVVFL